MRRSEVENRKSKIENPKRVAGVWADLTWSEYASGRSILLPLYPQMTEDEQDQVIAALNALAGE